MQSSQRSQTAVSPVVAVILLVAVTVTLSAVIGGFALNLGQSTTSSDTTQDVGVQTNYNGETVSATVVTGTADEVRLLVNGTVVDTSTNASAGDTLSGSANESDSITVITVSDGEKTVASSTTATSSTSDSTAQTTVSWTFVDGFEDSDVSEYTKDGFHGKVVSSPTYNGSYALEQYANTSNKLWANDSDFSNAPTVGDTVRTRINVSNLETAIFGFWVGVDNKSHNKGIAAYIRANSNDADFEFLVADRCGASNASNISLAYDEWYTVEVYRGQSDHWAKLYDENGSLVAERTLSSTCHSSNDYFGFHGNDFGSGGRTGTAHWDDVEVTDDK